MGTGYRRACLQQEGQVHVYRFACLHYLTSLLVFCVPGNPAEAAAVGEAATVGEGQVHAERRQGDLRLVDLLWGMQLVSPTSLAGM